MDGRNNSVSILCQAEKWAVGIKMTQPPCPGSMRAGEYTDCRAQCGELVREKQGPGLWVLRESPQPLGVEGLPSETGPAW